MSNLSADEISKILATITDENTEQGLDNNIVNVKVDDNTVIIDLELNYPAHGYHQTLKDLIAEKIDNAKVSITTKINAYSTQTGAERLPEVKNIIAIASGKGGVGKSTTAVNLALALKAEGATVAILDADIYGPSQPLMLGVSKMKPSSTDEGKLFPVLGHGIQAMSIGFLVKEGSPMVWRGPMVTRALEQMLRDTLWRKVDYMIIDLPPGTGDIQLTLSQKIPVSGSVIVTTPQDIALLDAKKSLKMFEKVNIPIIGIIENMSIHICSKCGNAEEIFGVGGGKSMALEAGVSFLGALPLDINIRTSVDNGEPSVIKDADGKVAEIYKKIARKVVAKLSLQDKEIASFPSITIE